jgi:hypothetical protein
MLSTCVKEGDLACVEVLVALGVPHKSCLFGNDIPRGQSMGINQLCCLLHLLDWGWPIHPGTLIWAARRGDLDAMRTLHARGAPLWEAAYDEEPEDGQLSCNLRSGPLDLKRRIMAAGRRTITIPQIPDDSDSMWAALRYGWVMGAPVTPVMEETFKAQRAATRATLLCFHVASRLSRGEGTSDELTMWAVMGRVPIELVEKMVLNASFEIYETVRRPFQPGCNVSVRVHGSPRWWLKNVQIRLYAAPHNRDDDDFIFSILEG